MLGTARVKVKNGKMIAAEVLVNQGKIESVRLTGDFFVHPEEAVDQIENNLIGSRAGEDENELAGRAREAVKSYGAQLVGFSEKDVARVVKEAIKNGMESNQA